MLGLVVAFAAVALTLATKNGYFDVAGTATIGVLLVVVAITLAIEVKSLLLGESASKESIAKVRGAIESTPGVDQIIHMKTLHIAPEELLVAAKIGVPAQVSGAEVAETINAAERNIRAAEPMASQVYLEPDIFSADYARDERPDLPSAPSH